VQPLSLFYSRKVQAVKKSIYTILFFWTVNFNLYGQWQQLNLNPSLSFSKIQFVNDTAGFITTDNTILETNDSGLSWDTIYSDINVVITGIFFFDKDTGYFAGWNSSTSLSFLNKTFDGGNSWHTINMSVPAGKIFFTSTSKGFNHYLTVYKSINGGTTWTMSGGGSGATGNIFFLNDSIGYVAAWYPGVISKTTDAGTSWTNLNVSGAGSFTDIYFPSLNTGYVIGCDSGIICKTNDGGSTWTMPVSGISPVALFAIYCPDNNTCYAVGDSGTILKTTDGGNNWQIQNSGVSTKLSSVYCTDGNTCYAAGGFGVVLKTTNGGVGISEHSEKKGK
jgi:photosystem II stability/assembly factor-like uncharacterized protein